VTPVRANDAAELAGRWEEVSRAVEREFAAHRPGRLPPLAHDPTTFTLRAERAVKGGRREWFAVPLTERELRERPPAEIARRFFEAYYACT
jgi:hypothetical protein